MQERTVLSGMDLKAYLGRLKQNPKYTEEIIKLIEDDLRFGLTKEETEEYSGGRYDYRQMCVYSRCLRNGYNEEEKAAILKEGLSGDQMAVALEFYEKGVPMDTITEVLSSAENTAYTMKRLFSQVLKKIREAEPVSGQDTAYAKELMEQIREVVEKISYQEKRYDALNEKLKEIGTAGQDVQVQSNLIAQLSEKDKMLEKQQNELNEARVQIAKLHGEIEAVRKERKALEEQVKNAVRAEPDAAEPKEPEKGKKPETKAESSAPGMPESALYPGIEYHAAVVDKDGNIIRFVPVERMERKDRGSVMGSMFSRLFLKKKTDIVKLLAEKDLSPEQLVQVRSAIEKGLSEKQLLVLINSKIPAEQMEEIINIAVYENKMKEGQ
jgi:predicted  nucleic acid-binding Zn-ribbon protein